MVGWESEHFGGFVGYSVKQGLVSSVEERVELGSGHTIREDHIKLEQTALPVRLFLAWNATLPSLEVESAVGTLARAREKPKRVVFSPLLPDSNVSSKRSGK